ncbi:hypothetical protein B0T14DRAFT_494958 [Immersiella caudata]|uniref:Uncharacterized protein n=1 Tax=Immersiella caudata TaxID=314043 RepID=A0AA40C3Z6_9PEZI|nr:hypothetical protein B0T14DRAFT_494958 [Immersiella caudata]
MGNHDTLRPPRWVGLLLMASVSAAQTTQATQGLTLSNFGLITSTGVPLACILTYNSVLPGCQNSDFTQGSTCSTACVNGIRSVQRAVLTACDQVSAPPNSVLGQALAGNLVELLCPASGATTSSPSKKTTTASTATTPSTTLATVPTTMSKVTLTPVASSTVNPSRTETLATDIPTLSPPSGPSRSPPSPSPAPTRATGPQQAPEPGEPTDTVIGGGSPFDAIVTSKASNRLTGHTISACLVGLALSLLLAP